MKIGIPKALLYYKYHRLWEEFFDELSIGYTVSPDTNKGIFTEGAKRSIDEACLSSKIYMGHVHYLLDKCDCIFVPRIGGYGKEGIVCTRFQALYDLTANTFPNAQLIGMNMDPDRGQGERRAFIRLGMALGKSRLSSLRAYERASRAFLAEQRTAMERQRERLSSPKTKILVVAHYYNLYDPYIGGPILCYLEKAGVAPILADVSDYKAAIADARHITETLPWAYNKHLTGTVYQLKDQVDGILFVSAFPCGPDSMINEIVARRVKGVPMTTLVIDGQEGFAGMETRLESFIDIIHFKRGYFYGEKQGDVSADGPC